MDHRDVLIDFANRQLYSTHVVLRGIADDALHAMPLDRGNSVAWLVWHAARQQDAGKRAALVAESDYCLSKCG